MEERTKLLRQPGKNPQICQNVNEQITWRLTVLQFMWYNPSHKNINKLMLDNYGCTLGNNKSIYMLKSLLEAKQS